MRILQTILILNIILWTCASLRKTGSFLHVTDILWRKRNDNCTKHIDNCLKLSLSMLLKRSEEYHPTFVMWSCAGGRRAIYVIKQMKEVFKDTIVLPALPPVRLPASKKNLVYYQNISSYFGNWLDDEARKTFWKTGYYSRSLKEPKNLQIIVLNTAFFCQFHALSGLDDPAGQWTWLTLELIKARSTKKKVYLLMSATPDASGAFGDRMFTSKHNDRYINVVETFSDVIKGQFGGYEDTEKFHLFTNKKGYGYAWLILTPPFYRSIRIYFYDLERTNPIDYIQFYKIKNDWQVQYRFTEHYTVTNMSIASFEKITKNMEKKDKMFFNFITKRDFTTDVFDWGKSQYEKIRDGIEAALNELKRIIIGNPESGKRPKDVPNILISICNHTKVCMRICICKTIALTYRGYVECVTAERYVLMGSMALSLNISLFLNVLLLLIITYIK